MSKATLGFEVITRVRNCTGFSPIELLVVVAIMMYWPQSSVGYSRSSQSDAMKVLPQKSKIFRSQRLRYETSVRGESS